MNFYISLTKPKLQSSCTWDSRPAYKCKQHRFFLSLISIYIYMFVRETNIHHYYYIITLQERRSEHEHRTADNQFPKEWQWLRPLEGDNQWTDLSRPDAEHNWALWEVPGECRWFPLTRPVAACPASLLFAVPVLRTVCTKTKCFSVDD